MVKVKVFVFIGLFLILSSIIVTGDMFDIKPIDKEKIYNVDYVTAQATELTLIQTKVDENRPCYITGQNEITCEAINDSSADAFGIGLNLLDKTNYFFLGVPVSNIQGKAIDSGHISKTEKEVINVDLSKPASFKIGFNTNEFMVVDLTSGTFNNTEAVAGNVQLSTGKISGAYYSRILDLNTTKTIVNVSFESAEPVGSDVALSVRTFNFTDNTGLSEGLTYYTKMDGSNVLDYSGYNTSKTSSSATSITSGRFSNAFDFEKDSSQNIIYSNSGPLNLLGNFTLSMWFNAESFTDFQTLIGKRDGAGYQYQFRIRSSKLSWLSSGGSFNAGTTLSTGTWYHTVVTRDSTGLTIIYLNGVSDGSGTKSLTEKTAVGTIGSTAQSGTYWDGLIDEVAIWNRTFSPTEVTSLYNNYTAGNELKSWNSFSPSYTTSPSGVSVNDGRYVQVLANLTRSGTEYVHLDNFTIGYTAPGGAPPTTDNPPTSTLVTANGQPFSTSNVTLASTQTDDNNLVNATIWTNSTGTWLANQTILITGLTNSTSFTINNTPDGTYKWNVLVCDNSTAVQCVWATSNRTYSVSTSCVDSACYPYVCDTGTNACYTSCNSHDQVNSSSYCNSAGVATPAVQPVGSCLNLEWSGLADNPICTSQSTGFCFNDIGGYGFTDEFCTNSATGCVHDGTEYSAGEYVCGIVDNDAFQCIGGESDWSAIVDCRDFGESYDASATVSGHQYCGYYNAQTCSDAGCVDAVPATQDCGSYYYTGSSCGTGTASCDTGCGAIYDTNTCNVGAGYTLSADCSTCTPPAGDITPIITLTSPEDGSIQTNLDIDFNFNVYEDINLTNCSLLIDIGDGLEIYDTIYNPTIGDLNFNYIFTGDANVEWNVECYDNATQRGVASSDFSFQLIQGYVSEYKTEWAITQGGERTVVAKINESGVGYFKSDLIVEDGVSNLQIDNLDVVTDLDVNGAGLSGVKITNPVDDYIRFFSIGGIDFGLFNPIPLITTSSSDRIRMDKILQVDNTIDADRIIVNNELNVTSTANFVGDLRVTDINLDKGRDLEIGGGFAEGGSTISSTGSAYFQNLTVFGGTSIAIDLTVNGSILPPDDNIYDLGSPSMRWRDGYFGNDVLVNGSLNINEGQLYVDDATGRVGIGTVSPTHELNVVGTSNFTDDSIFEGNVGIGTASPTANLQIGGNLANNYTLGIGAGSSNHAKIIIGDSGVSDGGMIAMDYNNGGRFEIGTIQGGTFDRLFEMNRFVPNYLEINGQVVGNPDAQNSYDFLWRGDTDTKLLFVDAGTDRIGIGTSNPQEKLHISGTGAQRLEIESTDVNSAVLKLTTPAGSYGMFANNANDRMTFYDYTDSREIMTLDGAGRVGIGTVSPTHTLNVVGTSNFTDDSIFGGDVGIGVGSPSNKLVVSGTTTGGVIARFTGSDVDDNYHRLFIDSPSGDDSQLSFSNGDSTKWSIGNKGSDNSFNIKSLFGNFTTNTKFTILSGGNVGIGTSNPTHLLNVNGTMNVTGNTIIEGTLEVNGCPSGFTLLKTGSCIQTAEEGSAGMRDAMMDCYNTYGGRIPTLQEWIMAVNSSSLTDEEDDYERVSDLTYGLGSNLCSIIGASGVDYTDFTQESCGVSVAYRCIVFPGAGG